MKDCFKNMFEKKFPQRKMNVPEKSLVPKVEIEVKREMAEIVEAVMETEKFSQEFYSKFSQVAEDEESKVLLKYLSNVEGSHYRILKSEHDLMLRFLEYHEEEYFHFTRDMIHFGP